MNEISIISTLITTWAYYSNIQWANVVEKNNNFTGKNGLELYVVPHKKELIIDYRL